MRIRHLVILLAAAITLAAALPAAARDFTPDPRRYENDMARFERQANDSYPVPGCVVFMGSSSIRGWHTLEEDFPDFNVALRGYGGSQLSDAIYYVGRIVVPIHPSAIVLYAGDNDIAAGKSVETVVADFKDFVKTVNSFIGPRAIYYLSIKPSLARWELWPEMKQVNEEIEKWAATQTAVYYIDVATPMLGADGKPRPELFQDDGLHMVREGYQVWTRAVTPMISRE